MQKAAQHILCKFKSKANDNLFRKKNYLEITYPAEAVSFCAFYQLCKMKKKKFTECVVECLGDVFPPYSELSEEGSTVCTSFS